MGLEVLSNVGATYREIPKEVMIKTDNSNHTDMMNLGTTQHIAQTETKAVSDAEESTKYYEENGGKSKAYQNGNQKIKKALEKANKNAKRTHCEFNYHEETNRISISIRDDKTGDIIKEIPAEETLDMLSRMYELAGLFVDDKR